jgi:aerobic-type carbon monoxide dehydrogenase small subunit (CoxS/CutS family)
MTAVDETVTTFSLNGQPTQVRHPPNLLEALREELGVTSPKDGCSPSGQCGCCTVLLDGKAVSCQVRWSGPRARR